MKIILTFLFLGLSLTAQANCTLKISTNSVIGPGTNDYIERALETAKTKQCNSVLYLINTPGGSLQSTRLIVEQIVNSPIPFYCLVYPRGGHAGSAGAIILQACHVNGAVEATNIGAATPVTMGGEMGEDMRKKIFNDTTSWLDGLTELRGRNKQFAREIVTEAKAVNASEAKKLGAIDLLALDVDDFLKGADNRTVKMSKGEILTTKIGVIENFEPDIRFKFLDLVTHPQVAYLIFMASLGLLYFELTNPGMIAPGVVGALGLVISLMSFHMLDVRWGALLLILLGIAFMIAEIFVTSFGALGIGGLAAFVAGSLLLFDPAVGSLPLATVLPSSIAIALGMLAMGYLALSAQKTKIKNNSLVGEFGEVTRVAESGNSGQLEIHGEIWNFESMDKLNLHDRVVVNQMDGLKLVVTKSPKEGASIGRS